MSPPIEILVHVSGPSRGADDARYRREAQGILDFEPLGRHRLCSLGSTGGEVPETEQQSTDKSSTSEPFLLDVQPTISSSEQSAPDGFLEGTPAAAQKQQASNAQTPAPLLPPLFSTVPTTIKVAPHLLVDRTPALLPPRPHDAQAEPTPAQVPQNLRRSHSDLWQSPPSVIPNSQPTYNISGSGGLEISSSPCRKRAWESSSPSPTRAEDDEPAKPKRLKLQLASSSSPINAQVGPEPPQPSIGDTAERTPKPLPQPSLEIHPPAPLRSTSPSPYTTHLTPSLLTLSTALPPTNCFHPNTYLRTRPLHPLERGHWLLPLSPLPPPLVAKFWDYLTLFIGESRAGWGTWAVREMVEDDSVSASVDGDEGSATEKKREREDDKPASVAGTGEEIARIYCWGEVVSEVWLVLWIASNRQIKGTGAKWMDARGEAVVVMK
ncbi:hypothetical protein MMC21_008359 [Puttea exsequens]|nr:hypothetical protein [Puttea exsequens]